MTKNKTIFYPSEGNDKCFQIEDESFWFRQRNLVIDVVVNEHVKKGIFADVGGGNGYVSSFLKNKYPAIRFIFVEPGEQGCINAKARGLTEVYNKTLNNLSEFVQLENIGIFDVIEHIENDQDFLIQIYNKLSPGGKVFLTTPAYPFLWSSEDTFAGHFRRYTLKTLKEKAIKAGFKESFSSYFFLFLIIPIFLFRCLPEILKLKNKTDPSIGDHKKDIFTYLMEKILRLELLFLKMGLKFPVGASIILCLEKETKPET